LKKKTFRLCPFYSYPYLCSLSPCQRIHFLVLSSPEGKHTWSPGKVPSGDSVYRPGMIGRFFGV
jgi:hypothetical protein